MPSLGTPGRRVAIVAGVRTPFARAGTVFKDMSAIVPGHGGLMDRLDSLIAVAPVAWLIMNYLVPVSG